MTQQSVQEVVDAGHDVQAPGRVEQVEGVMGLRELHVDHRLVARLPERGGEHPRLLDRGEQVVGAVHDEGGWRPGVHLVPDCSLEVALEHEYEAVILPGGLPGADHLGADERIIELLRQMDGQQQIVGAVCAAPKVLKQAGVLEGRNATSFPGVLEDEGHSLDQPVVRDGHVMTSRGPGTAMDFALEVIEALLGPEKRQEVEAPLQRPS